MEIHGPLPPDGRTSLRNAAMALEASFLTEMLRSAGLGKSRDTFGGGVGEDQHPRAHQHHVHTDHAVDAFFHLGQGQHAAQHIDVTAVGAAHHALGLAGAQIVFNPSATSRGLSSYLWQLEQTAASAANMYYVGAINRVGIEDLGDNDFYGTTYFSNPRGQFVEGTASDQVEELLIRDLAGAANPSPRDE